MWCDEKYPFSYPVSDRLDGNIDSKELLQAASNALKAQAFEYVVDCVSVDSQFMPPILELLVQQIGSLASSTFHPRPDETIGSFLRCASANLIRQATFWTGANFEGFVKG